MSTKWGEDTGRYVDNGHRPNSQTENIVTVIKHAIDIRMNGERVESQRIINDLIARFPTRAHSIRITAANYLTDRITNGTTR